MLNRKLLFFGLILVIGNNNKLFSMHSTDYDENKFIYFCIILGLCPVIRAEENDDDYETLDLDLGASREGSRTGNI